MTFDSSDGATSTGTSAPESAPGLAPESFDTGPAPTEGAPVAEGLGASAA
ncbi:hypothetical protein [Microbacterium lacticum]